MSISSLARRVRKSLSRSDSGNPRDRRSDNATPHSDASHSSGRSSPGPADGHVASSTAPQYSTSNGSDMLSPMHMSEPEQMRPPTPTMPVPEPFFVAPNSPPEMLPRSMDGALAELAPMQTQLNVGPSVQKIDKALDSMGERIDALSNQTNRVTAVMNNVTQIASALEQTDIAQKIERGIQRFADDIPWLMKGLDELARIHPVVTVAVLAFKAVYTLESTRQENDRRVITLYVEMKDMMMVMVQLKGVENRTHIGLDGTVLKDRLEELAEKTAKDIKSCANFCDMFSKKRLLVKVFKGPVWAEKLTSFVKVFTDRKAEFEFALAMHTANSLTDVKKQNYEIQAKLDVMLGLFSKFVSADERKLVGEIESKGGTARVRQDDDVLKSLIALDLTMRPDAPETELQPKGVRRDKLGGNKMSFALDELKLELREDVDDALQKNFETFAGKFELQVSLLQVALERYIRTENDRVIGAVTNAIAQGPHMRIKDMELRKIWQDMGWRGNVKARLFVLTLQDHYRDLFESAAGAAQSDTITNDDWALEYLGISYMKPLMEAFDDDASGYVTITEVNKLMDLRPSSLGWSIPHWLAYWAIGWRVAATSYVGRIRSIIRHMQEASSSILPLNHAELDLYFSSNWGPCLGAVLGLQTYRDAALESRFRDYAVLEEGDIRTNLEKIKYLIDTPETVSLIVGSGRLEKSVYPLLCVILEHDLRRIKAASKIVIDRTELYNMRVTLFNVFLALNRRYFELCDLFTQQKLDLPTKFKEFAFGLFTYVKPDSDLWSVKTLDSDLLAFFSERDEQPIDLEGIEEEKSPLALNTSVFDEVDEETEDDLLAPDPVKAVLGAWNGFAYDDTAYPVRPMISLHFHYSHKDGEDYTASGIEFDSDPFTLSGTRIQAEDGTTQLHWTISYPAGPDIRYVGRLVDDYTIEGLRFYGESLDPDTADSSFFLKRVPAEYLCMRPSPARLEANRYRELWNYAISATLHDVRRRRCSWQIFAARRDIRKRYLRAHYSRRRYETEIPEPEYNAELNRVRGFCTAKGVRFFESIATLTYDTLPWHSYMLCDSRASGSRNHYIEGARYICLTCVRSPNDYLQHISFCDDPDCYDRTVEKGSLDGFDGTHHPSHDFLKIRTVVEHIGWPNLVWKSRVGLERVRDLSGGPPDPPAQESGSTGVVDLAENKSVSTEFEKEQPPAEGAETFQQCAAVPLTEPATPSLECIICREPVSMGHCWYCLDCSDYICNKCESQMLIQCQACDKPFPQSEWFYGYKPNDFICHMCCARGVKCEDGELNSEGVRIDRKRHVYTHPLLQCKRRIPDLPVQEEHTEEETIETRLTRLQERVEQLQSQLSQLESKQEVMQETLLSKFTEALTKILGRNDD